MQLDRGQLAALSAVLTTGSFDRAARSLGVTQSAVSQRLKALEERLGCVLVVRGQPCVATASGERLCRHADELALLERKLSDDIGVRSTGTDFPILRIAVNADSLATWFVEAMALSGDFLFDLKLDDQAVSAEWLRRGEVWAAVSSESAPVQGCDVSSLGGQAYIAAASPAFIERWFNKGVSFESLSKAPALTFNAKDGLPSGWSKQVYGRAVSPRTHWVASATAYVEACVRGIGWGLHPHSMIADDLSSGRLIALVPETPYVVPLFWHVSRAVQESLSPVSEAVRRVARRSLLQLD
ncbi:MAG: LysR family transcriptional regulator ArgP [Rhodobacteraceae bacterium]|nr:LysR family transcriptional regulator ArgP [Paracoccaceae bacterium]